VKGGPENQHGKVSILFLFPRWWQKKIVFVDGLW
jgi:hypothetical protein